MGNSGPPVCMLGGLNFVQDTRMKRTQVSEMVNPPPSSLQRRNYKIHQSLTNLTHASNFLFSFDSGLHAIIPRALSLKLIVDLLFQYLVFLYWVPSYLQLTINVLKFKFYIFNTLSSFKFMSLLNTSIAQHVSAYLANIRCIKTVGEIAALLYLLTYLRSWALPEKLPIVQ
jgi:hypothetical protein